MATTSNTYTGNGSNKLFSITFPYLDTTDIDVYLNGTLQTITTQYTFANATTIEFVAAPANGAVVLLKRSTDDATLQATFFPGSSIKAADLNLDFDQVLYIAQETANTATTATSTATSATTTANTALSQSSAAVSTANTASSNASAAVSTANTASTNASNAVTTANTASSNATTAVNTANAATSTANTASSNASAAVSTANTASSNASAAVSTANTASSNASAAVSTANAANSTANTASTNASNAVTTANAATATANTANTNSNTAVTTANAAAAAVANAVLYTTVANVAAIPGSPANNAAVEVTNSTGIQSFTPLSGLPAGFIGSSGLSVRIIYQTSGATWTWIQYFPNDPETRYLKLAGGTVTGNLEIGTSGSLTFEGATADAFETTVAVVDPTADRTITLPNVTGTVVTSGDTGTVTSTMILDGTILNADVNASAAIAGTKISPDFGSQNVVTTGTATAASLSPTGSSVPTNGVYLPSANNVAISTNGTGRLFVNSTGQTSLGTSSPDARFTIQRPSNNQGIAAGISLKGQDGTTHGGIGTDGVNDNFVQVLGLQGIKFHTNNTDGTANERMRLDSSGRLGLGTSSPGSKLEIAGTSGSAALGLVETGVRSWAIRAGGATTNKLDIADLSAGQTRLTIDSSGNVGIGTNSPGSLLHLVSSGQPKITVADDAGRTLQIHAPDGSSNPGFVGTTTNHDLLLQAGISAGGLNVMRFNTAGAERVRIDSSGRLLVGTSTSVTGANQPQYAKLQVVGNTLSGARAGLIALGRSAAASTIVAGDALGGITFGDNAAGEFAYIFGEADGTAGTNDYPGRLVFSTTADGASSPTERFRISNDGSFSSVIPGGSTLYPRFGCRAWVNFNGTGTVAIRGSGNVSSITDHGVGAYTINFTTAMPDVNYTLTGTAGQNGTGIGALAIEAGTTAPTTTTVRIFTRNFSNNPDDFIYNGVAIFR